MRFDPTKPDVHLKGWGWEEWVANHELYCQKFLIVYQGKKCSLHYHKIKDETFSIVGGVLQLDLYHDVTDIDNIESYTEENRTRLIMNPGDVIRIQPFTTHQFTALEDCVFTEVSTQHFEDDSYRIVVGDQVYEGIEHRPVYLGSEFCPK